MTTPVRWEEKVQARVVKFWEVIPDVHVYDLSQGVRGGGKKHATTRQTPGLPDLIVVLRRFRVTVFQEVKAFTADELRRLSSPSDWLGSLDLPPTFAVWRAMMQNPALYAKALSKIAPAKRLELLRKKRNPDQVILAARLEGQVGVVYCCGGVEEAFACYESLNLNAEHHS